MNTPTVISQWRLFFMQYKEKKMAKSDVGVADVAAGTAIVGLGMVHWLINILFPIAVIIIMLKSCS